MDIANTGPPAQPFCSFKKRFSIGMKKDQMWPCCVSTVQRPLIRWPTASSSRNCHSIAVQNMWANGLPHTSQTAGSVSRLGWGRNLGEGGDLDLFPSVRSKYNKNNIIIYNKKAAMYLTIGWTWADSCLERLQRVSQWVKKGSWMTKQ